MFKIENKHIYLTKGDKAVIDFSIPDYQFKIGDIISMGIYEKRGFTKDALFLIDVKVDNVTDKVEIIINSDDTKDFLVENKPVDFWYEIQLNHEDTIIGYDEEDAKIITIFPGGSDRYDRN